MHGMCGLTTLTRTCLRHSDDYEQFLEELEMDRDMRRGINLYKRPQTQQGSDGGKRSKGPRERVMLEELLEALSI